MKALTENGNIVLTGMPGVGKSTIGVLLAKNLNRSFVDTDLLIQAREHVSLQEIAAREGREGFRDIECASVCSMECQNTVIATGGSVVYRDAAMEHLRASGVVVFMDVGLHTLEERLGDLDARGVSREPGQSLSELFEERRPLYDRHADFTVNLEGLSHEGAKRAIESALNL